MSAEGERLQIRIAAVPAQRDKQPHQPVVALNEVVAQHVSAQTLDLRVAELDDPTTVRLNPIGEVQHGPTSDIQRRQRTHPFEQVLNRPVVNRVRHRSDKQRYGHPSTLPPQAVNHLGTEPNK